MALQPSPSESLGAAANRYGQCGPIGSAQYAVVGVETPLLTGTGEIPKEHRVDSRMPTEAGSFAGTTAHCRHYQHGPIHKAFTQLGDADLPGPLARVFGRSQPCGIIARCRHSKIGRRWPIDCRAEQIAEVRTAMKLPAPFRHEMVQEHTVGGSGRGFELSDEGRRRRFV